MLMRLRVCAATVAVYSVIKAHVRARLVLCPRNKGRGAGATDCVAFTAQRITAHSREIIFILLQYFSLGNINFEFSM